MDHEWMPDRVRIERAGAAPALLEKLTAMGHVNVAEGGVQGDANSIAIDAAGTAWGANDRRSPDGKASVPGHLTTAAARK
jgi:gamma-glutamyltranspeptidase